MLLAKIAEHFSQALPSQGFSCSAQLTQYIDIVHASPLDWGGKSSEHKVSP
jgi:hypothetical protein